MKYIILIIIGLFTGCTTSKSERDGKERLFDLLHIGETIAYKSITIKDYTTEEEC
jgi:hypothetical protein